MSVRVSAVHPDHRVSELARAMYASAADLASGLRCSPISLDKAIDVYGYILRPGLCGYKLRLGFVPVPTTVADPGQADLVAGQVVRADGLLEPVLVFVFASELATRLGLHDYLDAAPQNALELHGFVKDGERAPRGLAVWGQLHYV